MGRKEDARRVLNQVLEKARGSYFPGSWVAEVYAALGENDEAFHWLERAFTEHDANLLNLLQFPAFRPLYLDPRFVDLVRLRITDDVDRQNMPDVSRKVLSIPHEGSLGLGTPLTAALLRLDPMFDPLRNDPRFQKLSAS